MSLTLQHAMRPNLTTEEEARGRFVAGIRSFILNDLAGDLRTAYEKRARPAFEREFGHPPSDGSEVHAALRGDAMFNIYSSLRVQAQKMVWSSVIPTVDREAERLAEAAERVADKPGSVTLDPDLEVPRNVSAIDVHLLPGSYVRDSNTMKAGAVYDQGLSIFSMGLMGANLDDIGLSMARYISERYPDFAPREILDLGCTVGHNTLPWKQAYPDAHVRAIDAAPSGLLYGSARAKLQGQEIDFIQMKADELAIESESVDLVFSSMFLHELSKKTRTKVFEEAYRVLRPGGLMLHMELPPHGQMSPFENFYLDWDSYYNAEPFYKAFREEDPRALCEKAGFAPHQYLQFVVPSIGIYGGEAIAKQVGTDADAAVDRQTTGRLAEGVHWFGFGAWKQ